MAQPSPHPVRYPSGVSGDFPFGPLANFSRIHPFRYNHWVDDFDTFGSATFFYTKTVTNTGTVDHAAGNGGLVLFTTAALAADLCSLQLPVASFAFTKGKRAMFMTRLQVSSAANAAFLAGLIQTTTTPFTVTDGVYFSKATGAANNLSLNTASGSTIVANAVPTAAYTLADATNIDLAWTIDRNGDVMAFIGSDLVGWQSQNTATLGPVFRITAPTLPTANLNVTLAVQSGTATAKTMTVDFVLAAQER